MKSRPTPPTPDYSEIYAQYYDFRVLGELMRQNIKQAWLAGHAARKLQKPAAKKAKPRKHK